MKDFKFMKFSFLRFGFFLSWIAAFVMVTSPLALAEQSKNLNKEIVAAVLKEMGVADNKNITMGEVWKRVRLKIPAEVRPQLDLYFQTYKDEKFPSFDVSEVKNPKGENIIALNMSHGSDTSRIEFIGKENSFMKFNGKNITANDMANVDDFLAKFQNEKINKKDQQKTLDALRQQPTFPTYEIWKRMSRYERAHFLVQVRLMMREVDNVLSIHESMKKPTKSSQLEKDLDLYLKLIFGQDANAAPEESPKTKGRVSVKTKTSSSSKSAEAPAGKKSVVKKKDSSQASSSTYTPPQRAIAEGKECIVGGYPYGTIIRGKTTGTAVCTLGKSGKLDSKFVNGCSSRGKTPQISCNPILYGYNRTPAGGPICVDYDINNPETQIATTANGACEKASPLVAGNSQHTYDMIYSILKAEKNMDPNTIQSLLTISSDGKSVEVEQKAYDSIMKGPDGIFQKFENEKKLAESVCGEISKTTEKNPSAYELPKTKQQTKACTALLDRTMSLKAALATVVIAQTAPPQNPPPPCPETAPVQDTAVVTQPVPTAPASEPSRNVQPLPVNTLPNQSGQVVACCDHYSTCTKKPDGGVLSETTVTDTGRESSPPIVSTEKEEKKSGFPWATIAWLGVGAVIFSLIGYGIYKLVKPKKKTPENNPPYVAPQATSVPISTPTPAPPAAITNEGGTGTSGATGAGVR